MPRSPVWEAARKKIQRNKLSLGEVLHPMFEKEMTVILGRDGRILPRASHLHDIVIYYHQMTSGERCTKLYHRIKSKFLSVSEHDIQVCMIIIFRRFVIHSDMFEDFSGVGGFYQLTERLDHNA